MVFSLVQVVELGCLLLFQVAFMCIDFFLVMCLFVSGCFPSSSVDFECLRWVSVVLHLV